MNGKAAAECNERKSHKRRGGGGDEHLNSIPDAADGMVVFQLFIIR